MDNQPTDEGPKPQGPRRLLRGRNLWILIFILGIAAVALFYKSGPARSTISYSFFMRQLGEIEGKEELNPSNVLKVEIGEQEALGVFKEPPARPDEIDSQGKVKPSEGKKLEKQFRVTIPSDSQSRAKFYELLQAQGVQYDVVNSGATALAVWWTIAILLPLGIMLFVWILFRSTRDKLMGDTFLSDVSKSPARGNDGVKQVSDLVPTLFARHFAQSDDDGDLTIDPPSTLETPNAGGETPAVPSRVFGDYELLEVIARGGMGVVYKARQVSLNRIVALKMILSGDQASTVEVTRFRIEAEAAARLDHPGIVPIHEVGEIDGRHFFSMGYVDGPSLAKLLERGLLAPKEAARLVAKIAQAVHYAHEHGIVHRDLKPGNILIDASVEPRVTDFGLAKRVEQEGDFTLSGQVLGTPSYMSPEQAAGKTKVIGPCADIYSLGAILYALVTGRPPFVGASVSDVLLQVIHDLPVAPRNLNRKVVPDLSTICLKCLEKDPHARYRTALALSEDLSRYDRGEPIHARPIGRVAKTWRWCKRHKAMSLVTGALALSLLYPLILGMVEIALALPLLLSLFNSQDGTGGAWGVAKGDKLVFPGVAFENREELEKALSWDGAKANVFRFTAGPRESNKFDSGGHLKIWIELRKKDAEMRTVWSEVFDLRAGDVSAGPKECVFALMRHGREPPDGFEDWKIHYEHFDTEEVDSMTLKGKLASPISGLKNKVTFESRTKEGDISNDAGPVDVWSETKGSMSTTFFYQPSGKIVNQGVDTRLFEISEGKGSWKDTGSPDHVIRIMCRLLRDSELKEARREQRELADLESPRSSK